MTEELDGRRRNGQDPVAALRQYLKNGMPDQICIRVDHDDDADRVSTFLTRQGFDAGVDTDGRGFYVEGHLRSDHPSGSPAGDRTLAESGIGALVVISSQGLAGRDDILGRTLLREYILALTRKECRPGAIVFLHEGVCLAVRDSAVTQILQKLASSGTQVLLCGASLEHYKIPGQNLPGSPIKIAELAILCHRAEKIIRI